MESNYKLVLTDGTEIEAQSINWVTWNLDGGGGIREAHDNPAEGRSLIMDMQTMSMDALLALSKNNYEGLESFRTKSVYKYLSQPIVSVDETIRDPKLQTIKFTTPEGQFTLLAKTNPAFRGRSPFSLG